MRNAIETFLVFLFSILSLSMSNGVYQSSSSLNVHDGMTIVNFHLQLKAIGDNSSKEDFTLYTNFRLTKTKQ